MMTAKTQILVMEPGTTQMINGPSAPTESNLESWLKTHPTFHAVLPKTDHKSKFYGHKASKLTGYVITFKFIFFQGIIYSFRTMLRRLSDNWFLRIY